jgi:hypothetical protein
MNPKLKNAIDFAEQLRTIAVKLSEFKKVKIKEQDIVLLYDELKVGANIWASLADDHSDKMPLPVGDYNLANDKTIAVNPEGTIEAIRYTPTHNQELKTFIQSLSIKR